MYDEAEVCNWIPNITVLIFFFNINTIRIYMSYTIIMLGENYLGLHVCSAAVGTIESLGWFSAGSSISKIGR